MLIRRAGIDDVEQLRLLYQELEEDGVFDINQSILLWESEAMSFFSLSLKVRIKIF